MNNSDLNQFLRENIIQKRSTYFITQPNNTTIVYTFSREKLLSMEPDEDLIDKLSPYPHYRYVYRWKNGRIGAIFPTEDGHVLNFREYKLYDGPDDKTSYPVGLRPVKEGDEDSNECNEPLAFGIVAYYLHMRNKKNPKDIFADYLEDAKLVFQILRDADMRAWNPKYKKDFIYSEHYHREQLQIEISSLIFDFLGEAEITDIKIMAANYLQFVKSQITKKSLRELTQDEVKACFKRAVLRVMNLKNDKGDYVFYKNTHWIAVYCYAVDIFLLVDDEDFFYSENDKGVLEQPNARVTTQYKAFNSFIHELQLDQETTTRLPFKCDIDLSKSSYKPYRSPHPWPKDGLEGKSLTLYTELDFIYTKLNDEYREIENFKSIILT